MQSGLAGQRLDARSSAAAPRRGDQRRPSRGRSPPLPRVEASTPRRAARTARARCGCSFVGDLDLDRRRTGRPAPPAARAAPGRAAAGWRPQDEPGGTLTRAVPSSVGTSTVGSERRLPWRHRAGRRRGRARPPRSAGAGCTRTRRKRSPAGPPPAPLPPSPASRMRWPSRTPGGIVDLVVAPVAERDLALARPPRPPRARARARPPGRRRALRSRSNAAVAAAGERPRAEHRLEEVAEVRSPPNSTRTSRKPPSLPRRRSPRSRSRRTRPGRPSSSRRAGRTGVALLGSRSTSYASEISLKRSSAPGSLLTSGWFSRASLR